jgi:perosamine synthetase
VLYVVTRVPLLSSVLYLLFSASNKNIFDLSLAGSKIISLQIDLLSGVFLIMWIPLSRPDISDKEVEVTCAVLRSHTLALGPKIVEFEKAFAEYVGRTRAVAVNSGTSGLFLCMKALGIGQGDEVITTPFTFIASTTSIMMAGAKPVFVDIDASTLNIDPGKVESAITDRTKAVLPVEIFGNPEGFDSICEIAKRRNLYIIEDSCEALGSELNGQKAGTFGTMSVFGFYPNKQITTGEGGMIVTDDDNLADSCISLRNQGRSGDGRWLSHERLGYNFRLSDIQSALGLVQLLRIDEFKAKRRQVAKWYQQKLAGDDRLMVPTEPQDCDISWFVFVVLLSDDFNRLQRDEILKAMQQHGIQASNYFPPVHLQSFIAEQFGHKKGDFPITESVSERTIALPFHNNLTEDEVAVVCRALKEILDKIAHTV